jgi:hypothetical protein
VVGYVVYGYDEKGNRRPIAGDHDLFDVRNANGSEMSDDQYDTFIDEMIQMKFGVMHGGVVRWKTKDPSETKMREGLIEKAEEEGLVRFAPGQPARFVYPNTPLHRTVG